MGTKTIDGVWFLCFPHDHTPPHVHGRYAGIEVVLEIGSDGRIRKADRPDAITPRGAKRSHVRHILRVANRNYAALLSLWEAMHGSR